MFFEKFAVVRVSPRVWGGDDETNSEVSQESVIDNIFSRGAETQSKDDADWDSTGDQDQSDKTEREESDSTDSDEDKTEEEEETDSSEDEDEGEETEEEDSEFQLPKKQAKEYPDSVMSHFAKRLGVSLADLKGNPALLKAAKQLVDNAIHDADQKAKIEELSKEDETEDEEEETTEETKEEEKKPLTPQDEEANFTAFVGDLDKFVDNPRVNDPRMMKFMETELAKAWGIDLSKPENVEALKKKGIDIGAQLRVMSRGAVNLISTVGPMFVKGWVESAFPGFGRMYGNALQANVWEDTAKSKDFAAAGLPEYGTPEFQTKFQGVLKANPWIDETVFKDPKSGNILAPEKQIAKKFGIVAKLMSGQKVDQTTVDKALETGRREERKANGKKNQASKLGAGKTAGEFGKPKTNLKASGGGFVEEYEKRKNQGF